MPWAQVSARRTVPRTARRGSTACAVCLTSSPSAGPTLGGVAPLGRGSLVAFTNRSGRRLGTWGGGARRRRLAPLLWTAAVTASLAVPWWVVLRLEVSHAQGSWRFL